MKLLYSLGIYIAGFLIKIIAPFNRKLKLGVAGRSKTFNNLQSSIQSHDKTLWFHCASLGEYEQGLPVFEELRALHPNHKIVLSFFSPSGYEIKKDTAIADVVVYLPLDTRSNAKRFLNLVHPEIIVFVKYEIWPNFLNEIKSQNIKAILISAVFRKNQSFFKWYGGFMKRALFAFEHIFVQNEASKALLKRIDYNNVSVSGDTRFDRVHKQLSMDNSIAFIDTFKSNKTCIVFGSTWPEDDSLLIPFINQYQGDDLKFLIAPHNIKPHYIKSIRAQIQKSTVCFSELSTKNPENHTVFILDTIGYLSKAYSYGTIAYVGGGAGKTGLHNILEPAVFGIPIIIGKNHSKFPEAQQMIDHGGVFSVKTPEAFNAILTALLKDMNYTSKSGQLNANFIAKNKGAVIQILDFIRS